MRIFNQHRNQLGDWCPWSGVPSEERDGCPAGCPDGRAEEPDQNNPGPSVMVSESAQIRFDRWLMDQVTFSIVERARLLGFDEAVAEAREINSRQEFCFDGPVTFDLSVPLTHTERESWSRRRGLYLGDGDFALAVNAARSRLF